MKRCGYAYKHSPVCLQASTTVGEPRPLNSWTLQSKWTAVSSKDHEAVGDIRSFYNYWN